jgi:hypothetical protein
MDFYLVLETATMRDRQRSRYVHIHSCFPESKSLDACGDEAYVGAVVQIKLHPSID